MLGRKEYYTKDRVYVSYTDNDVCFEELDTADSILIRNDGVVLHSNFDKKKSEYFLAWFKNIYPTVVLVRSLRDLKE